MRASSGFTLRSMLVAIGAFGVLMTLSLPAINASREAARQDACVSRMGNLALALHSYHDVYRRLPHLTSTQIRGVAPASSPSPTQLGAGYHWQVALLPFLKEPELYDELALNSKAFSLPLFDPAVLPKTSASASASSTFAANQLPFHTCPAQRGNRSGGAPEFLAAAPKGVSRCSYVAIAATHLDCMLGDSKAAEYMPPNGVLIPGPEIVKFRSIVDGTSETLLFAETRERNYSSWYDGTVGWVVAVDPNGTQPTKTENGILIAAAGTETALNVGPESPGRSRSYLPAALHPQIAIDWEWGPSSEHLSGTVVHAVTDGSVRSLTGDIDATLYLQMTTRAGNESSTSCTCE